MKTFRPRKRILLETWYELRDAKGRPRGSFDTRKAAKKVADRRQLRVIVVRRYLITTQPAKPRSLAVVKRLLSWERWRVVVTVGGGGWDTALHTAPLERQWAEKYVNAVLHEQTIEPRAKAKIIRVRRYRRVS